MSGYLRRIAPYAVAVAVVILAIVGLMWRPATVSAAHRADYVVIAGAAGLRWDDVTPDNTPTLWKMAGRDAIAGLSVVSAHDPTCPIDGWVTLGAGNYARRTPARDGCDPPRTVRVTRPDSIGGRVDDQVSIVADNEALTYGAEPGALADAVRCTVAVGSNAALAAAHPFGRVDKYTPALPANAAKLLNSCTLSIVDLGTISATDPTTRAAQAHAVDGALARVLAARPDNSLVLVAGVADTADPGHLHVAIADGPGYTGGWLTSAGTGRPGYLQLVDLAPTALVALGKHVPDKLMIGGQAQRVGARPADPTNAVARLADADREASVAHGIASRFAAAVTAGVIVLVIASIPLLRRARRSADPHGPPPFRPFVVRTVEALLLAAAITLPVAIAVDVVPWWRVSRPGPLFVALGAAVTAAITAVLIRAPWRRLTGRPGYRGGSGGVLGPLTAASAVGVAIIGLDSLTGSRLQLGGVAGYSVVRGEKYFGIGGIGLGAFVVAVLMLGACIAQYTPERRWRPAVVGVVGGLGVIVVGSPQFGADPGGSLALTAGVCVAAAIAAGGWLTFLRLVWATIAGLVVLIGFAVLDLRRPVQDRGAVGQFLTELHQGTAGAAIHRTVVADVYATTGTPLTLLIPVAILFTVLVLNRPWGGLLRLFGLYPAIRGAMTGMAVASVLAGIIDGVGLTTAAAAAAVALPLVTLAALRVLDHADDRTVTRLAPPDALLPAASAVAGGPPPAPSEKQRTSGPEGSRPVAPDAPEHTRPEGSRSGVAERARSAVLEGARSGVPEGARSAVPERSELAVPEGASTVAAEQAGDGAP